MILICLYNPSSLYGHLLILEKPMKEMQALNYFAQISEAVKYMHEMKVLHRYYENNLSLLLHPVILVLCTVQFLLKLALITISYAVNWRAACR